MRDKSGAQRVPAGSSLGILPADSGSLAAQSPALGQHCPDAMPLPTVSEHNRPDTMPLPTVSEHNRPDTTPLPTVSEPDRPDTTPLPTVSEHNRPDATPLPTVPEHNRPGASYAAVSVPDHSHVSPPPAAGHDRSRRVPVAAGSPSASVTHPTTQEETVYDRLFTAEEVQALEPADSAPVLDEEVRLLQVLIRRFVALGYDPTPPQDQPTVRQQQRAALIEKITVVGRAIDVLQRTLKTRQVLAADSPSELYQMLDEAAKYMEDPSLEPDPPGEDLVIEEYVPGSLPT